MIRRPPRSTRVRSSAASDVYKRQDIGHLASNRSEVWRTAAGQGAEPMTSELHDRLRKELEEERAGAIEELRSYGADPYSDRVDRLAGIDDNFADSAAATAERSEI